MLNKFEKFILPKIPGYNNFENRFKWGELYFSGKGSDLAFEFARNQLFEDNDLIIIKLPYIFKLFIHVKKDPLCKYDDEFMYGFSVYEWENLRIGWSRWNKSFDFPWFNVWQKTEILDHDFKVVHTESDKWRKAYRKKTGKILDEYDRVEKIKNAVSKKYPYKYILNDGTVQDRIATVHVRRMTWGMKWFPWKKFIRLDIDICFNEEVGERSGSWKGGCTGCSYSILPGEMTVEQTLRRMEKDRKF